jgi:hypothetical protein
VLQALRGPLDGVAHLGARYFERLGGWLAPPADTGYDAATAINRHSAREDFMTVVSLVE